MAVRSFTVVYEKAEGGGYYARVPALDLTTEGRTLKEAKAMARDAIGGYHISKLPKSWAKQW
jgi:predicted RNase H-like HicB family nuclease